MIYIPFIIIIIAAICIYVYMQNELRSLKRNGIRVAGTIIHNSESSPTRSDRLGGNINTPTIQFFTKEGKEIIAKPIIGFTSQHEIVVPSGVFVIYDPKKPQTFCIDFD